MGISLIFSFAFHFFSQLFVRSPQTTILPFCISFSWGWSWSLTPVQCHEPPSILLQALCVSDLLPWIYLSLLLHNHKGFDLGHTWMFLVFPYFLQYKSEFFNKEFMICTTDSSLSCFCWLYRQKISPLAARNTINLILVLTIWLWPCVSLILYCWNIHFWKRKIFFWLKNIYFW